MISKFNNLPLCTSILEITNYDKNCICHYICRDNLNIIYTGHINGELEPCGCSPKTDFGGFARLSGYLIEHRKELSPYILVDAGNFTQEDSPQGRLKAETALKSFSIIKYDAVALMKNETAFTDDFISPFIGMWAANILLTIAGIIITIKTNRETVTIQFTFIKRFIPERFKSNYENSLDENS